MYDELYRIEDARARLQTKSDPDCREELIGALEILSDLAVAVRDLQSEVERLKS